MHYDIYTDGSCRGNGRQKNKGGWAFIILNEDDEIVIKRSGHALDTTNNKMELIAVIESINSILPNLDFNTYTIHSDSAYICNCYTDKWYETWIEKYWYNTSNQPVKNKELWMQLIPYFYNEHINFEWTKGHDKNKYNTLVDKMAVAAAKGEI